MKLSSCATKTQSCFANWPTRPSTSSCATLILASGPKYFLPKSLWCGFNNWHCAFQCAILSNASEPGQLKESSRSEWRCFWTSCANCGPKCKAVEVMTGGDGREKGRVLSPSALKYRFSVRFLSELLKRPPSRLEMMTSGHIVQVARQAPFLKRAAVKQRPPSRLEMMTSGHIFQVARQAFFPKRVAVKQVSVIHDKEDARR
ncbi:Hypothetical predicted protein [Cloeon dipterum]|uniref:Uncharacterized protein n=1 Tax=Cloeon dipterum TaxID=197152 RepID=A0A8S1DSG5_9INSE|nr:Hypothetical predicted protein [Cloeon dipterum]